MKSDGVKFWRFKDNYKQEGILDKIIPIWRAKGDVTDSQEGRDLIVELSKSKTNSGIEYTVVQTIMYDDPTPLSDDADTMKEWMEDEMTWSDVYAQRPVEYLEAVARGETPVWDSELKKFVYGDNTTETIGGGENETIKEESDPQSTLKSMKTSFLKITNVNGGRDNPPTIILITKKWQLKRKTLKILRRNFLHQLSLNRKGFMI